MGYIAKMTDNRWTNELLSGGPDKILLEVEGFLQDGQRLTTHKLGICCTEDRELWKHLKEEVQ